MLSELGFDPAVVHDDGLVTIAFTHCPYAELAAAHPDVVCHLHRGLVEGFVESIGGAALNDSDARRPRSLPGRVVSQPWLRTHIR